MHSENCKLRLLLKFSPGCTCNGWRSNFSQIRVSQISRVLRCPRFSPHTRQTAPCVRHPGSAVWGRSLLI